MNAQATIRLELAVQTPQAPPEESNYVTLRLRNVGSGDLWVNKRMLVNTVHAPARMREVWFDVVAPDGESIPFSCKVRAGSAEPSHYRVLRPQRWPRPGPTWLRAST